MLGSGGGYYKDVEFTIDDRENRTPILLDRAFMKRLNVIVNHKENM